MVKLLNSRPLVRTGRWRILRPGTLRLIRSAVVLFYRYIIKSMVTVTVEPSTKGIEDIMSRSSRSALSAPRVFRYLYVIELPIYFEYDRIPI